MRVTLTTDASLCYVTRAAAWAAWAQSERGRFFGGNVLPGSHSSINPVEAWAAQRGLKAAVDRGIVAAGDHVILQTDSHHVATRLQPDYRSLRDKRREKRGLPPIPPQERDNGSPRGLFLRIVAELQLTFEIVCSGEGEHMREVDRFARHCMTVERGVRQGQSIEAAQLAAFEDAMEKGRAAWLKQQANDMGNVRKRAMR